MNYNKYRTGYRAAAWLLFGIYLILMVYFLFFAEGMGRTEMQEYHYNLRPFSEIKRFLTYYKLLGFYPVVLNLAGNVVAFVPFGAFLPFLAYRMRTLLKVTLASFEVSLLVEIIQLCTRVGCCDVDDLILNTAGGAIGYFCFWMMWHWNRKGNR